MRRTSAYLEPGPPLPQHSPHVHALMFTCLDYWLDGGGYVRAERCIFEDKAEVPLSKQQAGEKISDGLMDGSQSWLINSIVPSPCCKFSDQGALGCSCC